jgi:pilus assembly protein CpaF
VQNVSEVIGMEGDVVTMQDIFTFKQQGVDPQGRIQGTYSWSGGFPRHRELNRALREAGMLTVVGNKPA